MKLVRTKANYSPGWFLSPKCSRFFFFSCTVCKSNFYVTGLKHKAFQFLYIHIIPALSLQIEHKTTRTVTTFLKHDNIVIWNTALNMCLNSNDAILICGLYVSTRIKHTVIVTFVQSSSGVYCSCTCILFRPFCQIISCSLTNIKNTLRQKLQWKMTRSSFWDYEFLSKRSILKLPTEHKQIN